VSRSRTSSPPTWTAEDPPEPPCACSVCVIVCTT
jgi:hypothetical protein